MPLTDQSLSVHSNNLSVRTAFEEAASEYQGGSTHEACTKILSLTNRLDAYSSRLLTPNEKYSLDAVGRSLELSQSIFTQPQAFVTQSNLDPENLRKSLHAVLPQDAISTDRANTLLHVSETVSPKFSTASTSSGTFSPGLRPYNGEKSQSQAALTANAQDKSRSHSDFPHSAASRSEPYPYSIPIQARVPPPMHKHNSPKISQVRGSIISKWCTKSNSRWILQALMITFLGALTTFIRPIDRNVFQGCGYYIVFSGLAVLESDTGSCLRKSFGRFLGTILGGITGWSVFTAVTVNETLIEATWMPYVLLIVSVLFPLPWGVLRLNRPNLHYLSQYAAATGLMIILSGYYNGNTLRLALIRTASVAAGVALNMLVVHTILPNPATPRLANGLAEILRALGGLLEPAIEFSSGLSYASSQGCLVRLQRSDPDIETITSKNNLNELPYNFPNLDDPCVNDASNGGLSEWTNTIADLQRCHQLLMSEKILMEAALNEINFRRPRILDRSANIAAYEETRHLFFHVASFVYSVEAQLAKFRPAPCLAKRKRLFGFKKKEGLKKVQSDPSLFATNVAHQKIASVEKMLANKGADMALNIDLPDAGIDFFVSGLPPFLRCHFSNISTSSAISVGIHVLSVWAQTYGPLQQRLVASLSAALIKIAEFVEVPSIETQTLANQALQIAGSTMKQFKELRDTKRKFDKLSLEGLTLRQFESEASDFLLDDLSLDRPSEIEVYWDLHYAMTDQICVIDATLTALYRQLKRCFKVLQNLRRPIFQNYVVDSIV